MLQIRAPILGAQWLHEGIIQLSIRTFNPAIPELAPLCKFEDNLFSNISLLGQCSESVISVKNYLLKVSCR